MDIKNRSYNDFLKKKSIVGEIYPVGDAYNGYMDIYYHENGKFYMYGEGPTTEIGSNVDEMLNFLFGDDDSTAKEID